MAIGEFKMNIKRVITRVRIRQQKARRSLSAIKNCQNVMYIVIKGAESNGAFVFHWRCLWPEI